MRTRIPRDSKLTDIIQLLENAGTCVSVLIAYMAACGDPTAELSVRIGILGRGFRPHFRILRHAVDGQADRAENILAAFDHRGGEISTGPQHNRNWSSETNSYAEIMALQRIV